MSNRRLPLFTLLLAVIQAAFAQTGPNVPITVKEALYPSTMGGAYISGVTRTADPVTFGIPFPDDPVNGITSVNALGLSGAVAGQFRAMAVWPSGRLKWVLVDTLADINANQVNNSIALTSGSGNFGGADLATDNGDTITVATGAATFTIRKANFNLLDQVVIGGSTLVQSGQSQGLVIIGPDPTAPYPGNVTCLPTTGGSACNHEYSSSNDPASTVVIEENGPVKAVLKADGSHVDASGNTYMHFTVRMYFYLNKSTVKLTTILRNADLGTSNTFATAFKGHQGYEARIGLQLSGSPTYAIANETSSPTTGSLASSTDGVYLYQGLSKFMAPGGTAPPNNCPSAHDTNGYCVLKTKDLGYQIVNVAAGTVIQSGTSAQIPQGWADIADGNGAGVEIGAYQMAAYGSKSLEFRAGGSDVRIGILASENSQPYYQSWPQYSINDIWLNFHAASLPNASAEFLKFQHPLVAHADRTVYNAAGVFVHPLLDPSEEDNFYASLATGSNSPLPTSRTLVLKDNAAAGTNSTYQIYAWMYRPWESGGGGNQMDFSLGKTYNFITRGYTGGLIDAGQMYRFVAAMGFPRADGFTWRSQPQNTVDSFGQPLVTSTNKTLATRDWPATWEHVHIYGMEDYYYLTGDETIREGLAGPLDRYLEQTLPPPGTERGVGGAFMNITHLADHYRDDTPPGGRPTGDTDIYNGLILQGQNLYNASVKPDLCVSGYPSGCSVATNPHGVSRVRGVFYAGTGTIASGPKTSEPYCSTTAQSLRGASGFQESELLEGLLEFRNAAGPSWADYGNSLDLAYGVSQWALSEGYYDDGSGAWAPNTSTYCNAPAGPPIPPTTVYSMYNNTGVCGNGYRHYVLLDTPNSCSVFYYPIRAEQTVWYEFFTQQLYTGKTDWLQKFKMALARTAYVGASDEFGFYTIATVIDRALRPGNTTLVDVPVTATPAGGGTYTLSWTVPTGAVSYRIKYGPNTIVPWIGFDPNANSWTGDPSTTMPWFAATDVPSIPAPSGAAGSTQQFTATGLPDGQFFAMKAYVSANPNSGDSTPPAVSLTAPANGATVKGTVAVTVAASDNVAVASVQFVVDGKPLGSPIAGAGPYSLNWDTTTVADGSHAISAVATDTSGNTASSSITVKVQNAADSTPPAVSITAPASGATVKGTVTISATASDNVGVSSVQFTVDGSNLGSALSGAGPYTYSWDTTTVADGAHTIGAVASDTAGNTATASASITLSNSTTGLVISGVTVSGVSASGATITWTTNTASNSEVAYGPTTAYGQTAGPVASTVTSHSLTLSGLLSGTLYHYQAMSTDGTGNSTTSADLTFTTASVTTTSQTGIPIPVNSWTTFSTAGFPSEIVGYDATVYASAIKRHVVLGKYHHYSSEPNYCMNGWSYDENRWDVLDCGSYWHNEHSMEGGHPVGAFVYMPSRASILYWGGQSGSNQPEQAFHTWWWDVVGRTGRDKISEHRPGNIKVSAMAYDESRDIAVFYPDAYSKVEVYDPNANQWQTPAAKGTPPPKGLTFPTLDWDSQDQKTYLYGGATGNSCVSGTLVFNSDVYTFDPGTNTWQKLAIQPDPAEVAAGRTGIPAGRWYAGFAYDKADNIFLLVGGQNCNGQTPTGLLDTWVFDPTAMQWTLLHPTSNFVLRSIGDSSYQKLRYDPDHHAFVMMLPSFDNNSFSAGTWANYPARVWVYCYTACANVGTTATSHPMPAGTLNRNALPVTATNQTWARDSAIAINNNTIFAGWIETASPFFNNPCMFHHPYVESITAGGSPTPLGTNCLAMDSNAASVERDGEKLNLAVVNGTVWATWSESGNSSAPPDTIFAKSWTGTSWSGGPIGKRNTGNAFQGFSQMVAVGTTPTLAFIENNKGVFPDLTEAYVDQYNGSGWAPLGGKLNVNAGSRVESIGITSDGTNPWACWTEEVVGSSWTAVAPSQLYCAHWNGAAWNVTGGSLNRSGTSWAAEASVAYLNGRPYVAWTERTTAGNAKLYVQSYDGTAWSLAGGGPLNNNALDGWAFHPRLATDGQNLYISWEEQLSLGQPSRLYISQWTGTAWSPLGAALNMDPAGGSVAHSALAVMNGQPVAIWNEVAVGNLRQTYMKQWTGSSWTAFAGAAAVNASPCDLNSDGVVNAVDVQSAINQVLGKAACTTADLDQDGQCNVIDLQRIINASLGGACVTGK